MADVQARVARGSRIWVEGVHDAALVERVWGDDLRIEAVVVEPLDGIDDLAGAVRAFRPDRDARLGVLVDHLVPGSKESRIVAAVSDPHVLVVGHPYVDVWQAVKPAALGIRGLAGGAPGRGLEDRGLPAARLGRAARRLAAGARRRRLVRRSRGSPAQSG